MVQRRHDSGSALARGSVERDAWQRGLVQAFRNSRHRHTKNLRQQRALRTTIAIVILLLASVYSAWKHDSGPAHPSPRATQSDSSIDFDYYLASLSWSPTYCETNPQDRDQCGRRGYGFILHGLWPQNDRGGGPQDCAGVDQPDPKTIARALPFMPSRGLIKHEWRAHGRCSGLEPDAYFELADRAFASLRIPHALTATSKPPAMSADDVRDAFIEANPGMTADMLAVSCQRNTLSEVRICLDTDLQLKRCGRGVRMRCPATAALRIPLIR